MITLHDPSAEHWETNGICLLFPTSCEIEEEAGGLYEMTLVHPISDDERALAIQRGYIIKAPVPRMETPLIKISAEGHAETEEHDVWIVTTATSLYNNTRSNYSAYSSSTTYQPGNKVSYKGSNYQAKIPALAVVPTNTTFWKKISSPKSTLAKLKVDDELIYHGESGSYSQVTTANGLTGYVLTSAVEYLRTDPYIPAYPSRQEVYAPHQVREQLFRVYNVETDSSSRTVTARARHISYDLIGNVVKTYNAVDQGAQDVLDAMAADLTNDNDFSFYSDITDTYTGDMATKNVLENLLDGDEGMVVKLNARLIRDNYDMFILQNSDIDRGVYIAYGKNLTGIKVTEAQETIVTRIMPVGKDVDGNRLLLPEGFVDSDYIDDYPVIYAKAIIYDDIQVHAATDDEEEVTESDAYDLLRAKAAEEYDAGIDLPEIDVDVEFVNLGDTEEYSAYFDLMQVFLYDTVHVDYSPMGMSLEMQVTGYTFDAVLERYKKVVLSTRLYKKSASITGDMLTSGGVGGTKIAFGAVDGSKIKQLSVLTANIGGLQVTNAKIADLAVTTAKIQDEAVETSKIKDLAVETAKIKDLAVTDAKVSNLGVSYAKIKDLTAGTAIFSTGVSDELYINRLYVTAANIAHLEVGELVYKDGDGNLWKIGVDGEGEVTATAVEVEYQNMSDTALLNISEYVVYKGTTAPATPYVGQLWLNTSTDITKRCTAVTPSVVWTAVKASELHTSYISAVATGLEILSSGAITIKSGGGIVFESGGNLDLASGSGVHVYTNDFAIYDADGERELLVVDEDEVRVGADVLSAEKIKGDVPNTFAGGTIPWLGSVNASLNSIGKWLLRESTLTIPSGTYSEFSIRGFSGSRLKIAFSSGTTIAAANQISITDCDDVYLYAATVDTAYIVAQAAWQNLIYVKNVGKMTFEKLNISGYSGRTSAANGTQYGILLEYCNYNLESCCVDRTCDRAIGPSTGSTGRANNCFGGVVGGSDPSTVANLGYGIRPANGCLCTVLTKTFASVSGDSSYYATLLHNSPTPTGSTGTTPAAPTTKAYAVSAGYYDVSTNSGTSAATWTSGDPHQGTWVYGGSILGPTTYYGFGIFLLTSASTIVSDIPSGKTIVSATFTLRRDASYGVTGDATSTLYLHNLTSAPSGAPNTLLPTAAASAIEIAPGEEQAITLNAAALSALNGGTCKGFGFRGTGDKASFDVYGELTVTYG